MSGKSGQGSLGRRQSVLSIASVIAGAVFLNTVLLSAASVACAGGDADWHDVQVPGVETAASDGPVWYRAYVHVPDSWTQQQGLLAESITLVLENVVDACVVYVNGVEVGTCGSLPPTLQSAREEVNRFKLPPGTLESGAYNAIVLKFYGGDGRVGFLGRAPVLSAYHDECVLAGTWQARFRATPLKSMKFVRGKPDRAVFDRITPATSAIARPRQLTPGRHLSPSDALAAVRVAPGLAVDLVLSEPEVAQPLSLDFDERGRLWVVEYRQYPFPAGLKMVSRDKFYRATYDQVPAAPPHHTPGADRISIHEDTNGDGQFDSHRVFVDGLNIVSSIEQGDGGVWVLNPPYLLFYPDRDRDDQPDGDPEVHLEGFGLEDTHSIANSLTWGPDGWLYGAQGSTTSSRITVRGVDRPAVYRDGAMIWRYHPKSRRYEVFAEGGGNPFGIEIDAQGRLFSGHNGGNTRGFYYVQGGYFQKGTGDKYGPLSNPNAFGHLMYMQHGEAPRFSHDFIRYEGVGLPEPYRGRLLSIDPLKKQVIAATIQPAGATFVTQDQGVALETDDLGFRPVDIAVGPDGAVYLADFCEEFIAHGQHFQGQIDPSTGRVFRLRSANRADHRKLNDVRLADQSTRQLVASLRGPDRSLRRMALRLIGQRGDLSVVDELRSMLAESTGPTPQRFFAPLEALWALSLLDSLSDDDIHLALQHGDPNVRRWMVRLLGDDVQRATGYGELLILLSAKDADAEVRAQLACTAKRLPSPLAVPMIAGLLVHDVDADDAYLPLLVWWATEAHCDDQAAVLSLFRDTSVWQYALVQQGFMQRVMRRYASGGRSDLLVCAQLFELAPDLAARQRLLSGFEEAFAGRSAQDLPDRLSQSLEKVGGGSLSLRVRRGDAQAIEQALSVLADDEAQSAQRRELARLLAETKRPAALTVLLDILKRSDDSELTVAVLSALQMYDDARVPKVVVDRIVSWPRELRQDAFRLLASRADWARQLVDLVDSQTFSANDIPFDAVMRLRLHGDGPLQRQTDRFWPDSEQATREADAAELRRVAEALAEGESDPYRGFAIFTDNCAKCHQLFRQGGNIGPNLTSYRREDVQRMALSVVSPSLEVREGFETWVAITEDGRVINGFLVDQDANVIVLRGADGQNVVLPRDQLEELQSHRASLMPSGLLTPMSGQQIRDLFAFLRLSQPLNEPNSK